VVIKISVRSITVAFCFMGKIDIMNNPIPRPISLHLYLGYIAVHSPIESHRTSYSPLHEKSRIAFELNEKLIRQIKKIERVHFC
jgi:hypothetical protein